MAAGKTNGLLQEHLWWVGLLGEITGRAAYSYGRPEGGLGLNITEQPWVPL